MRRLTIRELGAAAAMGIVVVSGFALGWWQDVDSRRRATTATMNTPEWRPPRLLVPDLSADLKILAATRPFGASGQLANVPTGGPIGPSGVPQSATGIQWRIGGIVTTETSRRLVVLLRQPGQDSDRAELRQVGESLPDGSIVRSVDPSSVTIDRQGTVATVRMFVKN